jgi:hypothetical protein
MGLAEDVMKDTVADQKAQAEVPKASTGAIQTRTIEKIGPKGEPAGTQEVETHSGFDVSNPESERILGKRKGPPQLTRGVIYDKDGHAVSLAGGSHGESHLKSS